MRHFSSHADGFPQRRMWVNRLADIDGIRAHFNCKGHFANHVARMGADHATAEDLAVAMGFLAVVKQQFGHAFVAAIGNRAAGCGPGGQAGLDT